MTNTTIFPKFTIKDFLKKVEIANEVLTLAHGTNEAREYTFYMDYENYRIYKAKTYKEFKKIITEEFIPSFADELLKDQFELDTEYQIGNSRIIFSIE